MKSYVVNATLKLQHNDTDIAISYNFREVPRYFVIKVWKMLEVADEYPIAVAWRKAHAKAPNTTRTTNFVRKGQ